MIIGILGLVLSLLLFWIQKIRKYPSRLNYSVLACSKIVGKNNLEFDDDVSLSYKDYEVKDDLYYTKILVFNKRSSDVVAIEKDSQIVIRLPNNSKWLDIRVNDESLGVGSKVTINQETMQATFLSFQLLKKHEHILIEGLIESKLSLEDMDNSIFSFNHRIAELDTFENVPIVTENRFRRCIRNLKVYGVTLGIMLLLLVGMLLIPDKSSVLYRSINNTNGSTEYSIGVDKRNRIVVEEYKPFSLGLNSGAVISNKEFESDYSPVFRYHGEFRFYYNIVMSLFILGFYCFISLDFIKDIYRYKMVHKYIDKQKIETND